MHMGGTRAQRRSAGRCTEAVKGILEVHHPPLTLPVDLRMSGTTLYSSAASLYSG
jgi:hypothetical protein